MRHDRDQLKPAIRAELQRHCSPDEAITMTELHVAVTGELIIPRRRYDQTRVTRGIVAQLRREGCPIGNSRGGYFWAIERTQLKPTIDTFHDRALASLSQEKALRQVSAPDIARQIEIELQEDENHADQG